MYGMYCLQNTKRLTKCYAFFVVVAISLLFLDEISQHAFDNWNSKKIPLKYEVSESSMGLSSTLWGTCV